MSILPADIVPPLNLQATRRKKEESIAEYIIHMYQTEDLILTYDYNLDDILKYVIKHMSNDEQVIKELLLWYADIIDQMKTEKVNNNKKRLSTTQQYVAHLTRLHEKLLVENSDYIKVYDKAKIDILRHVKLSENTITNPIQICINGIYGMLLLKLNGNKVSQKQQSTLTDFGKVLAYLSEAYKKEFP